MHTIRRPSILISFALLAACSSESADAPGATAGVAERAPQTGGASAVLPTATKPGVTTGAPATQGMSFPSGAAPAMGSAAAAGSSAPRAPDIVETLPPEKETSVNFQLPQASEHYVYALNPAAGTVAIINASTQAIQTIKTSAQPTYLRTLEGTDNAIVLNIGSNDAGSMPA